MYGGGACPTVAQDYRISRFARCWLGLVSITVNDPNNQAVIAGATADAKVKGWEVGVVDANGNADQANSAIKVQRGQFLK
jgi:ABC-type sugar transport system substrate-binding protein